MNTSPRTSAHGAKIMWRQGFRYWRIYVYYLRVHVGVYRVCAYVCVCVGVEIIIVKHNIIGTRLRALLLPIEPHLRVVRNET